MASRPVPEYSATRLRQRVLVNHTGTLSSSSLGHWSTDDARGRLQQMRTSASAAPAELRRDSFCRRRGPWRSLGSRTTRPDRPFEVIRAILLDDIIYLLHGLTELSLGSHTTRPDRPFEVIRAILLDDILYLLHGLSCLLALTRRDLCLHQQPTLFGSSAKKTPLKHLCLAGVLSAVAMAYDHLILSNGRQLAGTWGQRQSPSLFEHHTSSSKMARVFAY